METKPTETVPAPAPASERAKKTCEIISCSRRTDVPAFKMDWLLTQIRAGSVQVANPRNRSQVSIVSLAPQHVRSWVFWSKDYANWIRAYNDAEQGPLLRQYDSFIFNFTINGSGNGHNPLEPGLRTSLDERLGQLAWLAATFGPGSIVLRFDPIVHYRIIANDQYVEAEEQFASLGDKFIMNNLADFPKIARFASVLGIRFIVVAFTLLYPYVVSRLRKYRSREGQRIELVDITMEEKRAILMKLREVARASAGSPQGGLQIRLCCVTGIDIEDIGASSCIDGNQITEQLARAGKAPLRKGSAKKDTGQREICNCSKSIDIAGYGEEFACGHACIYCYANPKI